MGYFSNGTEGEMYEAQFCERCIHYGDAGEACAVLTVHMLFNYGQHKDGNGDLSVALDILIPHKKGSISNDQCSMFIPRPEKGSKEPEPVPNFANQEEAA